MGQGIISELDNLNTHLKGGIDLFICSASFEDRCFQIADRIRKDIRNVIVFKNKVDRNETNKDLKIKNAKYIKSIFDNSKIVQISKSDPFYTSEQFVNEIFLKPDFEYKNIVIDITTFTHEALLILFKVLKVFRKASNRIYLLYNPAEQYCFDTPNIDDKWLSKGIKDIRTVFGYPGHFSPYKKLHLVILVGYETEKCIKLIERYEPSILSFGMPKVTQSTNRKNHHLNASRYKKLLSIYSNVNQFEFSCINPHKTQDELTVLIDKYEDYNSVIAPMNNKLSTIGAGLAAIALKKVQICYARANLYNTQDYSIPSKECIIYKM